MSESIFKALNFSIKFFVLVFRYVECMYKYVDDDDYADDDDEP